LAVVRHYRQVSAAGLSPVSDLIACERELGIPRVSALSILSLGLQTASRRSQERQIALLLHSPPLQEEVGWSSLAATSTT
jgi:hypothetical protein